ncbi:MAG TPA: ABC transporter substrate-binding protein [Armatimonadetes bacterium]|nr:ABC transporter substrate-binding protein [Armatimonadota bacterium]
MARKVWFYGLGMLLLGGMGILTGCPKKQLPSAPTGAEETTAPPTEPGQKIRLRIVTNGLSPFWDPMAVGMERAAKKYGVEAEWAGPPDSQVATQRRIIENFAAQEIDGMAISVIEAAPTTPVINELLESGIVVITFDSDAPESNRYAYIGTNNYEAGKVAGEEAVKLLPHGGKVVAFVGNQTAPNGRERIEGFKEVTAPQGIELVDVRDDYKDANRARANVEQVIQAMPDLDLLLGVFSYNGPAIAQAVKEAGMRDRIKIVCFDAEPRTLDHLEAGEIDATIVQKPFEFGYRSVELLYHIITLGDPEKARQWFDQNTPYTVGENNTIDTGVRVITPENVAEFRRELDELGVKSS